MHAVALLTIAVAVAAAPQAAVVDLSASPSPSLAEALRNMPELHGRCLAAPQTALIVADAASLGLTCAFLDDACLQKLVVLARVEELVALKATPEEVHLARVTPREVKRASARVAGSPAARARAAWGALRRSGEEVQQPGNGRDGRDGRDERNAVELTEELNQERAAEAPAQAARAEATAELAETPTASSGGVTLPLVIGVSGAGAALLFGAGTVGVSAALAQQLRGTQRGIPLDDSYDALQVAFWSLAALTTASVATGVVGLWLTLAEDEAPVSAP